MITEVQNNGADDASWLVRPNRSMTWREAKLFVAAVGLVSLAIGVYFLWRGFPLVLPFSGLETLAIAAAFYIVLESGENRELISISEQFVVIEKGKKTPVSTYSFQRAWVRVELHQSVNRWYPSRLILSSHGRNIELGKFLTDGERLALAKTLINAIAKNR